ncbi:DUF4440 domain-containing protein [Thalassobacillus sp. CUG 92003]|uniref:nuclear transport factor 2 family protein n=1 Tax=Thalassobacillus sp. CUG 92003 TaxID=2736641 RepID=UPI0015E6A6BA|nr:DUF4440 domain-containing protein [Thalassobacillus sp. CUG 92003]
MPRPTLSEQLYTLENELLQADVRLSRDALNRMLSDDFIEFGISGLTYTKHDILERLPTEEPAERTISHFHADPLATDIVLNTFRVYNHGSDTYSLRSSIWKREGDTWRMTFHQGTRTDAFKPEEDT